MQTFFQTLTTGLSDGSIYGSLALALVLIYKATEVINFAQGEMAMFTTYIAWALMGHGASFRWWAFFATLAIAFGGGALLQQTVIPGAGHRAPAPRDAEESDLRAGHDE